MQCAPPLYYSFSILWAQKIYNLQQNPVHECMRVDDRHYSWFVHNCTIEKFYQLKSENVLFRKMGQTNRAQRAFETQVRLLLLIESTFLNKSEHLSSVFLVPRLFSENLLHILTNQLECGGKLISCPLSGMLVVVANMLLHPICGLRPCYMQKQKQWWLNLPLRINWRHHWRKCLSASTYPDSFFSNYQAMEAPHIYMEAQNCYKVLHTKTKGTDWASFF